MSFDEQPGGDIHGERAAESEPSELSAFEKWWAMLSKVPYMSKKEIAERAFYAGETASHELRFDACRPYLKEGETAADALERLSNHSNSSGLSWNGHNIYGDTDSIKEARSAIEYKTSRFAAFAEKLWPDEDIDAPTTKETT